MTTRPLGQGIESVLAAPTHCIIGQSETTLPTCLHLRGKDHGLTNPRTLGAPEHMKHQIPYHTKYQRLNKAHI